MNANKKNRMSFTEFCDRLIADGAYQSEKDGHIYRASGNILSRQCRNGYYLLRKQYDGITYHFMEHRVVYYMHNGKFDEDLQINHKDFDRTNNRMWKEQIIERKEMCKVSDIRPEHYKNCSLECWDAMKLVLGTDGFISFCLVACSFLSSYHISMLIISKSPFFIFYKTAPGQCSPVRCQR